MASQTVSNYDAALKEDYLPPIQNAFPELVELWDEFEKTTHGWSGNKVISPVRNSRNKGVGAAADGGAMPSAGRQGYVEHQVTAKYNYARIDVTGPAQAASDSEKGAFAKVLTTEVKFATQDLTNQLDRQICHNGATNGLLATVQTAGTVTTLELEYAGATSTAVTGEPGSRFLEAGQTILIGTAGEVAAYGDAVTITSVTDADTIVIPSTTVAEHDLVVFGASARTGYAYEIEGVPAAMVQTGTYQNLTMAAPMMAYDNSNSATNRSLTEKLMQQTIDGVARQGGNVDLILAAIEMKLEYLDMMWGNKRYMSPTSPDAGFTAKGKNRNEMDFNGTRIRFIRNFPYNKMAFLTRDTWTFCIQHGGVHWREVGGKILTPVSGYDSEEALLRFYGNLACLRPSSNGYLSDITCTLVAA